MNKKEPKFFKRFLIVILILFLCLFAISKSGYVSKLELNRTLYTEEEIRKFEEKILNGEEINIDDYFKEKKVDYDNYFSLLGIKISNSIYYISDKFLVYIGKLLSYFI